MRQTAIPVGCVEDQRLLKYVRGELDVGGVSDVNAHLATCDSCRAAIVEGFRQIQADHGGPRAPAPSAGVVHHQAAAVKMGSRVGRYVVDQVVGEGGMGTVFSAVDPELQRRVAVKVLARTGAGTEQERDNAEKRLLREARAMAQLSHPNIVTVFDMGQFDGGVFMAMELVEGTTLKQWLRGARRTTSEILRVMFEAGRGLEAAHAAGMVHRDFKPDNVLIGKNGRTRVTDFGLVRSLDVPDLLGPATSPHAHGDGPASHELTRADVALGTPSYMAPEQFLGQTADARSDQYAYCVTLYESLYGRRPFVRATLQELARAVVEGRLDPPPVRPDVPGTVREGLLRGLRRDPAARFESMGALLGQLGQEVSFTTTNPSLSDLVPVLKQRERQRRRVFAAGALGAALVVGGLALALRPAPAVGPPPGVPSEVPAPVPPAVPVAPEPAAAPPVDEAIEEPSEVGDVAPATKVNKKPRKERPKAPKPGVNQGGNQLELDPWGK